MSKQFRPWDVDQAWLLPPSVRELVPEDHLAHFVRETVRESLDLTAVFASYEGDDGQPPFHPAMMVALLLYAYSQGVYSSRKIAQSCENRIDFMAVTAMEKPNFRTIALFRKRHLAALGDLFGQVLRLCSRAGLVRLGHVGLDGTKIRANASKHKAMSYARMQKIEPELAAEVKEWLRRAEEEDSSENTEHGEDRRGDELPEWTRNRRKRLEKLQEAKKALEDEARQAAQAAAERSEEQDSRTSKSRRPTGVPKGRAQRNFTDPESRIMKTGEGFQQCYNAQAAVDAEAQVIVAHGVTNVGNDVGELEPMVMQIRGNLGKQAKELSADKGYSSESNLEVLKRERIRGYVATGKQQHGQSSPTKGKTPPEGTHARAMWRRLKRGGWRSRYRLRKVTVEPVFGQVKSARGFRQFLLRGLEKVRSEWALVCTAHNLLKLARA
jgi:transposase